MSKVYNCCIAQSDLTMSHLLSNDNMIGICIALLFFMFVTLYPLLCVCVIFEPFVVWREDDTRSVFSLYFHMLVSWCISFVLCLCFVWAFVVWWELKYSFCSAFLYACYSMCILCYVCICVLSDEKMIDVCFALCFCVIVTVWEPFDVWWEVDGCSLSYAFLYSCYSMCIVRVSHLLSDEKTIDSHFALYSPRLLLNVYRPLLQACMCLWRNARTCLIHKLYWLLNF